MFALDCLGMGPDFFGFSRFCLGVTRRTNHQDAERKLLDFGLWSSRPVQHDLPNHVRGSFSAETTRALTKKHRKSQGSWIWPGVPGPDTSGLAHIGEVVEAFREHLHACSPPTSASAGTNGFYNHDWSRTIAINGFGDDGGRGVAC